MPVDRNRDSLVRLPEVRRRTGLSTATIYRKMKGGEFPPKVQLSANVVAWYESDVGRWVANPMGWEDAAQAVPDVR
ncbi:helix-turn-helix transcriptional regulator [Sphingomonas immobilis]|uniref:AlpA family phage regulatory protein n=1 Tax=Sphingomonas immobilis TaxID=3063997 RepID=A0ABT9A364_9SPHN|nr:AlpA family phage regulatory protein [Sphingomonas sp. CA1-15]MDO7843426.1 AlpA family phage regulatory protein [Sphingomonas sp. CA1-15]